MEPSSEFLNCMTCAHNLKYSKYSYWKADYCTYAAHLGQLFINIALKRLEAPMDLSQQLFGSRIAREPDGSG